MSAGKFRVPNPMIFVVWLAIFVPGHLFDWWVERAFSAGVTMLALFTLFAKQSPWESRRATRQAGVLFFLIEILFVASYVYSVAFNGLETGLRDYFEVARYLFLWVFIVYLIRHYDDRVRRSTETAVACSMYFCILVGLCYLYTVPVLSPFFRTVLYAKTKSYVNYAGTIRLAAPFENPNFLGFYAVQVLTYMIFFSRSKLRLAHIAASMLVIYFCSSRTAWVAMAVVLIAAFGAYAYLGALKMRWKYAFQLCLAISLFVIAGVRFSDRIMANSRLQSVLTAMHRGGLERESNAAGRMEQNSEAWEYFKRSPILGWGPSKYGIFDYMDNQYLLWMLRNGAAGAFLIMGGLILVVLNFLRSQRVDALSFVGACAFVACIAIMILTGEFLNNFRLFYLTWFLGTAIRRGRPDGPILVPSEVAPR
jgi:O-antigen ligase